MHYQKVAIIEVCSTPYASPCRPYKCWYYRVHFLFMMVGGDPNGEDADPIVECDDTVDSWVGEIERMISSGYEDNAMAEFDGKTRVTTYGCWSGEPEVCSHTSLLSISYGFALLLSY